MARGFRMGVGGGNGIKSRRYNFKVDTASGPHLCTMTYYENDKLVKTETFNNAGWNVVAWSDSFLYAMPSVTIDPNHAAWYIFTSMPEIVNGNYLGRGSQLVQLIMSTGATATFEIKEYEPKHTTDKYILKNGVLQDGYSWTKDNNSLNITEYSNYTYFLDNTGNSRGYIEGVNPDGYLFLKIECKKISGNGTPYVSKVYPASGAQSIATTRTTYRFGVDASIQPCIGDASGSYAVEVYNILLTDNP